VSQEFSKTSDDDRLCVAGVTAEEEDMARAVIPLEEEEEEE
jgi:hypothetical protein